MMKPASELLDNDELKQRPILSMLKPSLISGKNAVIKHEHILRSLSHGDISCNELFYHTLCLTKYTNQYNSFLSTNYIDSTNDTWIK